MKTFENVTTSTTTMKSSKEEMLERRLKTATDDAKRYAYDAHDLSIVSELLLDHRRHLQNIITAERKAHKVEVELLNAKIDALIAVAQANKKNWFQRIFTK
jgi:hypothetical protein